ncbi:MAG TPA: hypothetical protein VHW94_04355 [Candidatus Dormibacteraeota bacterium]|jgi:hypothetical protein|nr:hypothetical protein [Candidatus Dormibacteraeota bacterium]
MTLTNLRGALAAAFAAALVGTSACGASTSGNGAASTPTAAGTPASVSGSIAEDLTFTGQLAGHMSSAQRGDTYVCAGGATQFVAGPIVGDVAGQQVTLNITKITFHGPGSYPGGGVGFDVGSNHYYPAIGASPTGLVVNSDLRSGTLDLDLAANSDPKTVVGHVSGTWRCPPDAY